MRKAKRSFSAPFPLNVRGIMSTYSTGSHHILEKRSKPGCLGSCQQQGSRDRTVLLGSALSRARSRARHWQGEAHTNTHGRLTGKQFRDSIRTVIGLTVFFISSF